MRVRTSQGCKHVTKMAIQGGPYRVHAGSDCYVQGGGGGGGGGVVKGASERIVVR